MKTGQLLQWLTIGAAILSAGMWLGALQQKVDSIKAEQIYLHGNLRVPEAK